MTTKLKGICKGSFKYISQIFVVKEREMEIGLPTDVKHVAHIGWDGPDGTAPTWMNEFGTGSELTLGSMGSSVGGSRDQTWTSQDFERTFSRQTSTAKLSNFPPTTLPSNPKKTRRKKNKSSNSSPKSGGSTRSSRSSKSRSMLGESEEGDSRRNSVYL